MSPLTPPRLGPIISCSSPCLQPSDVSLITSARLYIKTDPAHSCITHPSWISPACCSSSLSSPTPGPSTWARPHAASPSLTRWASARTCHTRRWGYPTCWVTAVWRKRFLARTTGGRCSTPAATRRPGPSSARWSLQSAWTGTCRRSSSWTEIYWFSTELLTEVQETAADFNLYIHWCFIIYRLSSERMWSRLQVHPALS